MPLRILSIGFDVADADAGPTEGQLNALASLYEKPMAYQDEFGALLVTAYSKIREEYLESGGLRQDPAELPHIEGPGGIWRIMSGTCKVYVITEISVEVGLGVIFDPMHDLCVTFEMGKVSHISMA